MSDSNAYFVAVIGAGPSGLFGARQLANQGARVVIFNRDIKPGDSLNTASIPINIK